MSMYFALLDFLRFLAAFSVMAHHYFYASYPVGTGLMGYYITYGFLGVELFFIISGFVIYFSLRRSLKEYALGRFMRLYPLFWVICTFTYIFTVLFDPNHLGFMRYLVNLLMVNDGKIAFLIDGAYWTLTEEVIFYVLIGCFVYLFTTKRLEWFYAGWLAFSFLTFFFGLHNLFITKILLARYVPYFVFGGMLALIHEHWKTASMWQKVRQATILISAALLPLYISTVLARDTHLTNFFGLFDQYSSVAVESFFVIVPIAVFLSFRITNARVLKIAKIAGGITYPLYLLHQTTGKIIIGWFSKYGFVNITPVLVGICMIIVCYFIYRYEERWRKAAMKRILNIRYFAKASTPVASDLP